MAGRSSPAQDSDRYGQSSPETLSSPHKKSPPLPWTPQETVNLIQSYREKWYSLNRGQLKASQWEEVAIAVAARCGFDELSKSSTQCRHKIEKLRKRYKSERVKPYPNSWQFFELMDQMERGPLPIAALPVAMVKYPDSNYDHNVYDEEDDGYAGFDFKPNKSKSINNLVNYPNRTGTHDPRGYDEEEEEEELDEHGTEEEDGDSKLAEEIRGFAEGFMRIEKKKIEMMKEAGRHRMEMEKRRMDMILETHRKIANSFSRIFIPNKRVKTEI
ncbi:unnamed protein product [Cuscuta epithymum]|uniref:Myb/SANT-like DNA-binding domain-containing protein n=1 Tax=Cuscuta epithymum TaxID=186058 RepID=A0AAV0CIJ0_9ASTE|nr:unnamed protein product [Cuscuta epithymum]